MTALGGLEHALPYLTKLLDGDDRHRVDRFR